MADDKPTSAANQTTHPAWLNEDFFQKALRNVGDDKSKVTGLTVNLATAAGDNYSSTLYRVKAELADGGDVRFLVKITLPGTEEWNTSEIFQKESDMLADVIPRMQALLDKAAPYQYPPLAARHYLHGQEGKVNFIVMEDLAPSGFKMADRKRGLGLRHALLAIRSLARFHAASHALLRMDPELTEKYSNPWKVPNLGSEVFLENGVQLALKACRLWPGYEEYADILEKFQTQVVTIVKDYNDPVPDGYNVILHGDFWINNMMFLYEGGQPSEHRAVDLQTCHVTTPALDLLYFFYTSLSEDVSANYEDLLLREYHATLHEISDLLGVRAPTMEEFLADYNAHGLYAIFSATCVLPIAKAQKAPDLLASINGDQSAIDFMYQSPEMTQWMQRLLPKFKNKGWLPK